MNVIWNYKPTERQAVAHSAPQRYKLFGGAMGGGKSMWLCAEVLRLMLQYPGNRVVMARHHLTTFKNTTLVSFFKILPEEFNDPNYHNKSERTFTLPNGSQMVYMGLSEEQDVAKFKSMEFGAFAFDEANEICKNQFDLACTRLRWVLPNGERPKYFGLLSSNPEDCWLKDVFIKNPDKDRYAFIPSLPKDNPHLPQDYRKDFEGFGEEYFKRYWEGSWDDLEASDTVIKREWVEDAVEKSLPIENIPVIGADIARMGDDETVAYFNMGYTMVDESIRSKRDIKDTVFDIMGLEKSNVPALKICTDDIGLGGGVTDFLAHYGSIVDGINVGRRSEDERFFNKKAEVWWYARELFREGKVSIKNDEKLIRQLKSVKFRFRGTGKIIVEPKEETKKRLGHSPDRADALILALWAAKGLQPRSRDYNRIHEQPINEDAYGWDDFYSDDVKYA